MVAIVGVMLFTGALVLSVAVIAMMVGPQWRRIASLATGHVEPSHARLPVRVAAERRMAVRRWAATPVPQPIRRMCEAA